MVNFYNLLLTYVNRRKDLGSEMKVKWNFNLNILNTTSKEALLISMSCMAYVNDTTWIVASKENLQEILNIVGTFYKLNNSMINMAKSKLMVINYLEDLYTELVFASTNRSPVYSKLKIIQLNS